MKIVAGLVTLIALSALAGCNSSDAQLEFHPTHTKGNVYETFPGAYISSTRDGEYDLVLIKDTLRSGPVGNSKGPLQPVTQPPLQQAVCIHIFWKPTSGNLPSPMRSSIGTSLARSIAATRTCCTTPGRRL